MSKNLLVVASSLVCLWSGHVYAQDAQILDQECEEAFLQLTASEEKRHVRQEKERKIAEKQRKADEARRAAEQKRLLELERVRAEAQAKKDLIELKTKVATLEAKQYPPVYYMPQRPVFSSAPVSSSYISGYLKGPRAGIAARIGSTSSAPAVLPPVPTALTPVPTALTPVPQLP